MPKKPDPMIVKGYRIPKHHVKNMKDEGKETGAPASEIIRECLDQRYDKNENARAGCEPSVSPHKGKGR